MLGISKRIRTFCVTTIYIIFNIDKNNQREVAKRTAFEKIISTYRNSLVPIQYDDVSEDSDLHVADIRNDIVIMTLLHLSEYTEVRQAGIRLLRTGHVVLADALEVNHLGVEGAFVWITGNEAESDLCGRDG